MKSITKKISVALLLGMTLFLSSCLDSGSSSYIGKEELSFIAEGELGGVVYARTAAGFYITSSKIQQLTPGSMARITYEVRPNENETKLIDENAVAYVVELGGEPEILKQTTLHFSDAPDVPAVKFESLREPLYYQHEFFGDRWIFPYTYKAAKGQSAEVSFYKASDEAAKKENVNILVDVRLEITGTAEEGAEAKVEGDNIVVDFSGIRSMYTKDADDDHKIRIKFRYYSKDYENSYTSSKVYLMHVGEGL